MEKVKGIGEKLKKKAGAGLLDMVEDMLGSIDAFDQLAEMLKTITPLKAEVSVKGKKAVEVRALVKNGQLWVGFKRVKEKPAKPEPEEPTTEETTETEEETEEE